MQLVRKGCARKFAIICLPEERDLIIKEKKVTQEPIEDKHTDVNKKIRIKLRKEHKQQLKRLRHQRVKAKKEGKVSIYFLVEATVLLILHQLGD